MIRRNGNQDHSDQIVHDILRATLKNGEMFALDIAGAQHGYYESVTPWHQFMDSRVEIDLPAKIWKPIVIDPAPGADEKGFPKVLNDAVEEWRKKHGAPRQMLKLPGTLFHKTRDDFIQFLDEKLRDFVPQALENEKRV